MVVLIFPHKLVPVSEISCLDMIHVLYGMLCKVMNINITINVDFVSIKYYMKIVYIVFL